LLYRIHYYVNDCIFKVKFEGMSYN